MQLFIIELKLFFYFNLFQAYERFSEDIELEDNAYLDLPLFDERALIDEYKKMLAM